MVELLLPSSTVCLLLLIWFKSSAFVEYAKLFGLGNLFFVFAFEESLKKNPTLSYHEFLLESSGPSFALKLISCPLCLSVWVSLLVALASGSLYLFPAYNVVGLMLYGATGKLLEE